MFTEKLLSVAQFAGIPLSKTQAEEILDQYEPLMLRIWTFNDYLLALLRENLV